MASLPPSNSNLAFYLTDRVDTPLVLSTSPQSPSSQSQALKDLTEIAIKTYGTASRLELGLPQRVMISTTSNGPLILHSYLNPTSTSQTLNYARGIIESTRDELRPFTATTASTDLDGDRGEDTLVNGVNGSRATKEAEEESVTNTAPLLIGTVVASRAEEAGDARRAAARLEKIGQDFQRAWIKEQEEGDEAATVEQG